MEPFQSHPNPKKQSQLTQRFDTNLAAPANACGSCPGIVPGGKGAVPAAPSGGIPVAAAGSVGACQQEGEQLDMFKDVQRKDQHVEYDASGMFSLWM